MRHFVHLILLISCLISSAFAADPKKVDKIVNKHLSKEAKAKELKKQRAAIEARKNRKAVPPRPDPEKDPAESVGVVLEQEPNAFTQERVENPYKPLRDPGSEIQAEVTEEKYDYAQSEEEKRLMIQKLRQEAEKSGYRVNVI